MKYISQINALMSWQFNNGVLGGGEYRLYMTILHCVNQKHWEQPAVIPNSTIKFLADINNDSKLKRYRDGLINKGLITYDKRSYVITKLYRDEEEGFSDMNVTEIPKEMCKENVSKSVSLILDKDKEKEKDKDKGTRAGSVKKTKAGIEDVLSSVADKRVAAALSEFAEHRKKQKKPLTPYALERSIDLLEKLGGGDSDTMCRIVEQTILRNWQSFYALKDDDVSVNASKNVNDPAAKKGECYEQISNNTEAQAKLGRHF